MKQKPAGKFAFRLLLISSTIVLALSFIGFSSFTAGRLADDFLKQLGIAKPAADEKITNSILGGSLDIYGLKNARNIALGNRKAVAIDLLDYAKKHVNSAAFLKEYTKMRENYKPKESVAETPEQFRQNEIELAKKAVADMEASIKKADANTKPIFEKILEDARENLKQKEDPANKHHVAYAKNYPTLVKAYKENHDRQLADWERKYPSNQMLYVKVRLVEFMNATKDIDFDAELVTKNGKKYFVNPNYERKDSRWKMAFRAGKEVVEPAREYVQKWIEEIKPSM